MCGTLEVRIITITRIPQRMRTGIRADGREPMNKKGLQRTRYLREYITPAIKLEARSNLSSTKPPLDRL